MTATANANDFHATEFYLFMQGSHQTLEGQFERLVAAITADDRIEMLATWVELESKLLSHLEAEERFVLPAFAQTDRNEALALIREHGKIRELLLELGVAVELHYARLAPFKLFIAMLREHALREEALMYRWASTALDPRLADSATRHANTR